MRDIGVLDLFDMPTSYRQNTCMCIAKLTSSALKNMINMIFHVILLS